GDLGGGALDGARQRHGRDDLARGVGQRDRGGVGGQREGATGDGGHDRGARVDDLGAIVDATVGAPHGGRGLLLHGGGRSGGFGGHGGGGDAGRRDGQQRGGGELRILHVSPHHGNRTGRISPERPRPYPRGTQLTP